MKKVLKLGVALGVAAAFAFAASTRASTAGIKQDDPLTTIKTKLKDPSKPFVLMVTAKVKKGDGAKFIEIFKEPIKESRKEEGCAGYYLSRDLEDENVFYLHERWKSFAALETHFKKDYILKLFEGFKDVLDGAPDLKVVMPVGE